MNPEIIIAALTLFVIVYVAYFIVKVITKTLLMMALSAITYLGLVYLEYLSYQFEHLLLAVISVGTLYVVWKVIQIPGKVFERIFG